MNYYKHNGEVFAYDDEQVAAGYGADMTPMTPEEAYAHLNPPRTPEQVKAALSGVVQAHLDSAARAAGYDDIKSAVTYADEPSVPRFQEEGRAFRAWRSLVWVACHDILAQVEAGQRPIPTADELVAALPAMARW